MVGTSLTPLNRYPVLDVVLPPFPGSSEPIGKGKGKVWISYNDSNWLLKFPRAGHGEHWAEKISSELASLLEIDFPRVELACCVGFGLMLSPRSWVRDSHRSVVGRYAALVHTFSPPTVKEGGPVERDFYIGDGVGMILGGYDAGELSHIRFSGADVLALFVSDFDRRVRGRTSSHNVKDVIKAWSHLAGVNSLNPAPFWDIALEQLASYVLLAALVCNTDRNYTNWEIERTVDSGDVKLSPSPTFDYGSSLGRDLSDCQRLDYLRSGRLGHYLLNKRGSLFVSPGRLRAVSPMFLAGLLCRWRPDYTESTVRRIESLSDSQIRSVVDKIPSSVMTDTAKDFASQIIIAGREGLSRRGRGALKHTFSHSRMI